MSIGTQKGRGRRSNEVMHHPARRYATPMMIKVPVCSATLAIHISFCKLLDFARDGGLRVEARWRSCSCAVTAFAGGVRTRSQASHRWRGALLNLARCSSLPRGGLAAPGASQRSEHVSIVRNMERVCCSRVLDFSTSPVFSSADTEHSKPQRVDKTNRPLFPSRLQPAGTSATSGFYLILSMHAGALATCRRPLALCLNNTPYEKLQHSVVDTRRSWPAVGEMTIVDVGWQLNLAPRTAVPE